MAVPSSLPIVTPITYPASSSVTFGATITNVDLSTPLTPSAFSVLSTALYTHKVIVIPNSSNITPALQFALVQAFDPIAPPDHGHNDGTVSHKGQKSLLHGIGNSVDGHPEVKLVGGGVQGVVGGGKTLDQAGHWSYHRTPLSEEERKEGRTRWHR